MSIVVHDSLSFVGNQKSSQHLQPRMGSRHMVGELSLPPMEGVVEAEEVQLLIH